MSSENTSIADTASETQTVEAPQTETVIAPVETDAKSDETNPSSQPSVDDLTKELNSLKSALKKANAEAKDHRLKAKELDELKAQIEAEKLSEKEILEKKLADLQSQHENVTRQSQERIINYEVRLQAAQMGIVDPDVAARLLDWSEIEYDDNGSPTNVQDLLNNLLKTKPYLKAQTGRSAASSGGATNPSRSSTANASQPLSWESLSKMTAEQYNARRAEIQQWMSNPQNIRR